MVRLANVMRGKDAVHGIVLLPLRLAAIGVIAVAMINLVIECRWDSDIDHT